MFVRPTARNFGLRVDATVDERLDVAKETVAAAKLLSALHREFKDWGLTLLAYNAGEGAIRKAIAQEGTRDVWQLVRRGHENDQSYLAKVMAAVLVMKDPSCLD